MKKLGKLALIIVISLFLLLKLVLYLISKIPSVPEDYTETVQTGGELEAHYLAMGPHETQYYESGAMMSFQKYEIYYPSDIEIMNGPLPVVVFVNGTGVRASKYPALQRHMASWGFITIATEEEYAWNGFSAEMCVRYLKLVNEYGVTEQDIVKIPAGKVDMDRIGITGHSQGGIGVINAITDQHHAESYRAAVILSCGNSPISAALQWSHDDTLIHIPTLILGSTGNTDAQIASLEDLQRLYDAIPDNITKIMARRKNVDHGEMLYYGDGYVTAWFMYWLCDDQDAGKAFFGTPGEILSNENWQDTSINP